MTALFAPARQAFENAYAPYSQFKVGAALRAASGRIYVGANAENASFPEGSCAETGAIAAMVAAGDREICEVAIVAAGDPLCTPCGGCRQRLREFARPEVVIHLCDPNGPKEALSLGQLLPRSFGLIDQTAQASPAQTAALIGRPQEPGGGGLTLDPDPALSALRLLAPDASPRIGLILGSGLGSFADSISAPRAISYEALPGFLRTAVKGHTGQLVLGEIEGVPVACLQGRVHLYEGHDVRAINLPVRLLKKLGCEALIVTNASGSLRNDVGPGSIVMIEDHINMLGQNPLTGMNDRAFGPRFVDMHDAYDPAWRRRIAKVAAELGIRLHQGVYLATPGPTFETPAEIRAFRALGADLVGMSTVPEVIAARHVGLRVAGLSVVTNLAAGLVDAPLSHEQTLDAAEAAASSLVQLLRGLMKEIAQDGF